MATPSLKAAARAVFWLSRTANSFVPYLTANYAKIGVVDFRGFAYGLDSTIEKEGYDEILVLYNYQTFVSDNKVIYINRPTTLS